MTGKQLIKNTLSISPARGIAFSVESLLLFLAGAAALILHARLRWGWSVPGHHGVEFMAILMGARLLSRQKYAGIWMILGMGIVIAMPVMGFRNPISAIGYLFPALVMDLMFQFAPRTRKNLLWLTVIGGAVYMLVPVYRILLSLITTIPYQTVIKHGSVVVPLAGFLIFGMVGSLLGSGLVLGLKTRMKR